MAHTVFLTRGIKHDVDFFINELAHRYVTFDRINSDTKKLEKGILQLRLSPIQLWDLSYPKEHRDVIHNTIFGGTMGEPIHSRHSKFLLPLRMAMKLKKLPEYDKTKGKLAMLPPQNIELIAVGVKDDLWIEPDGRQVKEKDKSEGAMEGI